MLSLAHKVYFAMSCTLADKNRRTKMLRNELAGINDPFELLAEALADNERLRQIIPV